MITKFICVDGTDLWVEADSVIQIWYPVYDLQYEQIDGTTNYRKTLEFHLAGACGIYSDKGCYGTVIGMPDEIAEQINHAKGVAMFYKRPTERDYNRKTANPLIVAIITAVMAASFLVLYFESWGR